MCASVSGPTNKKLTYVAKIRGGANAPGEVNATATTIPTKQRPIREKIARVAKKNIQWARDCVEKTGKEKNTRLWEGVCCFFQPRQPSRVGY